MHRSGTAATGWILGASTRERLRRLLAPLATVVLVAGLVLPDGAIASQVAGSGPAAVPAAAPTTTNMLYLRVESAREWAPAGIQQHTAIPHYHWLVVQDDTGDPTHYGTGLAANSKENSNYACVPQSQGGDPAYPANCQWPSIHSVMGGTSGEVVAQGDETTLSQSVGIDTSSPSWPANDHNPNHSYMISVMADGFDVPGCTPHSAVGPTGQTYDVTCHVDGFKIDGAWFKLPLPDNGAGNANVTVDMQPYPLPLLTLRMKVWNDLQTNGAYDTGEPALAGFEGHISDVLGQVTTDWYGNPVCTTYQHDANGILQFDADGRPVIDTIGGHCFSDADGVISIPYLGPDRYSSTVTAPNGQAWYQTSTLEGWHDWDTWSIEGWNGYDPEFVQGAEPVPFAEFGFVQIQTKAGLTNSTECCNYASGASGGSITGTVVGIGEYAPQVGGLNFGGQGKHIIENIKQPLLSLIDTGRDDNTVYVGRGNADGTFSISNVPDGDYVLSFWDEDQAYLLTQANVSIVNGQAIDLGVVDVAAWHSQVYGKVCSDTNRNGKCDPGEAGIPGLLLNLLDRDNKVTFYGDNTATTDSNGNYRFPRAYPLGQWVVAQGYWEQFYTVGVTYQTNNQPTETTVMANGGFVDVSTLNLIGDQTRLDFAVHTYETPANASLGPTTGGIVGEVVATTTRNELDARFQAIESYEPGLPGATVHLYAPVKCDPSVAPPDGTDCTPETTALGSSNYLTDTATGALKPLSDGPDKVSGNPIDLYAPYTTETWQRPQDCVARGADGTPVQEQVLPSSTGGHDCLEAPLMSSQVGDNSVGDFMQVNGNYGFTAVDHDPTTGAALTAEETIPPGDYLVKVDAPADANGRPAYEVVKEEDVNIFSGDQFVAPGETPLNPPSPNRTPATPVTPAIPPFPCAGPNHTVNVVADPAQANYSLLNPSTTQGVYNPDMVDGGGSPYEGLRKPLCDTRLVTVRNGRSATPNFHFKTFNGFDASGNALSAGAGVPLPGRIFGIVVDDLNLSTNPKELFYGEKKGIANMPIGIYDFSNRLVTTIQSDPNGQYEVILPSTSSYNCPLPAGPCPGIYRFLANDPGQPGHLNTNFNPAYRTIGGFFEVWPGVSLPSDLAPTPVAFGIENPGTQQAAPAACVLNDPAISGDPAVPELWSITKPYMYANASGSARRFTLTGQGFGASTGKVMLGNLTMNVTAWSSTAITFSIPTSGANSPNPNPYQLKILGSDGQTSVNGLTFHVVSNGNGGYNPTVYEVGPGLTGTNRFNSTDTNPTLAAHAIQRALDAAASRSKALVVVYPNDPSAFNPLGSYFENLVIHSPVKLQGVGPGGLRADATHVPGTVIDGIGYGTDGTREAAWQASVNALFANGGGIVGPGGQLQTDVDTTVVPEGEVILAVARSASQYTSGFAAAIDGMTVQNGDVMDFVPNVNTLGNGTQVGGGNNDPTNSNQGGGIVALASTKYLQITNNIIRSNAGAYAGAIRVGTPLVGDNNNDNIRIANNRILSNGGSNLAGAIGLFNGARNYEIAGNDLCGNFSAEYGGAISHFGLSGGGKIHDNRIYFNGSYDEGGGVLIAGEPPANLATFGAGAGAVDVYNNLIQANLANDDGGGLRFLTAGNFAYNVYNNMIVNNISTHEGGGVAIDNAPNVRFYNNTVMKNITTATAATSNGQPAPAGLATALNNDFLQASLPAGSPLYSNPLLFNNIFWDNRAGTWDGNNLTGIGGQVWQGGVQVADPNPINEWDMGVPGTSYQLSPTNSILQPETTDHGDVVPSPSTNVAADPHVKSPFDATVSGLAWRGNPNFVASVIVAQDVPVTIMGDYHLTDSASPAVNIGAASDPVPSYQQPPSSLAAPAFDIDGQARPSGSAFDAGADEFVTSPADLSITKTDGQTTALQGGSVTYTIAVSNAGPNDVTNAAVTDTMPTALSGVTWTCSASAGSSCGATSGSGSINSTVSLVIGGSATYTVNGTVSATATDPLVNTASVADPNDRSDPNPANNTATDTDMIAVPLPTLTVLDNFNRANANTLGANWSQTTLFGLAAIRVNANQAQDPLLPGQAIWNVPGAGFGAHQGAAFTFANAPTGSTSSLVLKATGGPANSPTNFIAVSYGSGAVTVATTTNGGTTRTTRATFVATFVSGDTLSAVATGTGAVSVYRTSGATTTFVGSVSIPTVGAGAWTQGTGGGRIGIQLPFGQRIDNFAGGTVP